MSWLGFPGQDGKENMIVIVIANLALTTIGLLYLAWSLQGVWDIIKRRSLDKPNSN